MSKFDYRKLQALETEIVNSLQKIPSAEIQTDSSENHDFSLLLKRIKSDMREIRLQLISQIPIDKAKHLNPEPEPQPELISNTNHFVEGSKPKNTTSSQDSKPADSSLEQTKFENKTQSSEQIESANSLPQKNENSPEELTTIFITESSLQAQRLPIAESLSITKIAKEENTPQLTTNKTQITRIIAENSDPGIFSTVFSGLISPWIIFSAAVATVILAIFMVNTFFDDSDQNGLITGNRTNFNEIAAKKMQSAYPSAEKHSKHAVEAYEKGRQEMEKGNPQAAREYFRLAISITPVDKNFLQALKEADEQVLKHMKK